MGKTHKLAAIALIPLLLCLAVAQDAQIVSRVQNIGRMVRACKVISAATKEYNDAVLKADALFRVRFNPKIVMVDPDEKRKESVAAYKAAREALLKQVDAWNELIEEEDY